MTQETPQPHQVRSLVTASWQPMWRGCSDFLTRWRVWFLDLNEILCTAGWFGTYVLFFHIFPYDPLIWGYSSQWLYDFWWGKHAKLAPLIAALGDCSGQGESGNWLIFFRGVDIPPTTLCCYLSTPPTPSRMGFLDPSRHGETASIDGKHVETPVVLKIPSGGL